MPDYHIPLFPESYYHILSRAVGDEKLFKSEENYRFFLQRYGKYVLPVADTFAYCLLPNHFHFLIRIKSSEIIEQHFATMKPGKPFSPDKQPDFIMERISNFLNSYTKSFNKMYSRKGALFIDYLRRVDVKTESQFRATLFYIHKNPVHHVYVTDIPQWKWSSYHEIVSGINGICKTKEVINWFDTIENFHQYHNQPVFPKDTAVLE